MKKNKINKKWLIFSLLTLSCYSQAFAQNKTPDYWRCENKVSGSWVFGLAPSGCDAATFGEDRYVDSTYKPVVFDELKSTTVERERYMDELGAVIKESATLYIKKRKPNASDEEVNAFVHAAYTMAHQESYWTHYRQYKDSRIKMMRGDSGHGHGLMQVDDRWHFIAVNKGIGWNLVDNLIYGFEEYFAAWEKAEKASCLSSPNDFRARARSAYSAYNGGISKICRWTNSSDKWARNDVGFVSKYDSQSWDGYIKNPTKVSSVDVGCLVDGQENCPVRNPDSSDEEPVMGQLYQRSSKEICFLKEGSFKCISSSRDVACLQKLGDISSGEVRVMSSIMERNWAFSMLDRHQLCLRDVHFSMQPVGAVVQLKKDIYLRTTPAGAPITVLSNGTRLQIYDFEVRNPVEGNRYYRVNWNGNWGYFYAGNSSDFDSWAIVTSIKPKELVLARIGDKVRIIPGGGINLRDSIGGTILTTVAPNSVISVENLVGRGEGNEIYYKIHYQGKEGFIYTGRALPSVTYSQWTSIVVP